MRKILPQLRTGIFQRQYVTAVSKRWLKIRYRQKPVALSYILQLRQKSSAPNALLPTFRRVEWGTELKNPLLSKMLSDVRLGHFSLNATSLDLIETLLHQYKPRQIIEFGSGVSTVCLSYYMKEIHGGSLQQPYVLSFEQDEKYVDKTNSLLETYGLKPYAQVVHAPLVMQDIGGKYTECYAISESILKEVVCDFVLIDGPVGRPGVRFGTLPLVKSALVEGCRFLLDDALRDSELRIAQEWEKLPYLTIEGIYVLDEGLLSGFVNA